MVWFKIDDGFPTSRPVTAIARRDRAAAIGLWTLAGAWSAKELTDGHIGRHMLVEFASTPRLARILVEVGLWEEVENGWNFRNWSLYQPTRDEVLANRNREAERKRSQRESRRTPGGTPAGRESESGHPDPTRPDPTPTDVPSVGKTPAADAPAPTPKKKRKTSIRSDFKPNDSHRKKAEEESLDLNYEIERFVDHHVARGSQFVSWDAALNTWLNNAVKFRERDRTRDPAAPPPVLTAEEFEEPPPFLSPEEYEAWRREKPGRR